VDEVYHPLYHDGATRSAGEATGATVVGDFSKAFCLSGLRTGWMLERDPERRQRYWNARAQFSVSNNFPGELLAEVATRHRDRIFERASHVCAANLATLDAFFEERAEVFEWVRPKGGTTAFPRLRGGADARAMCEAAIARGVLVVPGDCFGRPDHFRLGFGACEDGFDEAVRALGELAAIAS
jgi:aspartate/methionine/tyrosine aminotransferase